MPRFVVLRHEVGEKFSRSSPSHSRSTHFDWMFELDGHLRTFATDAMEIIDPSEELNMRAESLANHRLEYLHYEGEVSGDRGVVTRVASGDYELIEATTGRWSARLHWTHGIRRDDDYRVTSIVCFEADRDGLQFRLSATR